jgi:hypothetical protein
MQKQRNMTDKPRGVGMLGSSNIIVLATANINKKGNSKQ